MAQMNKEMVVLMQRELRDLTNAFRRKLHKIKLA
jgi:hypothetical protein